MRREGEEGLCAQKPSSETGPSLVLTCSTSYAEESFCRVADFIVINKSCISIPRVDSFPHLRSQQKTPEQPTGCFCRSRRWEGSFRTAGSGLIVASLVPPAPPPAVARRPGVPTAWPRTKPKDLVTVQSSCFFFFLLLDGFSFFLSLLKWTCVASC